MEKGVNAPMHNKNHGKELLFSIIIVVVAFGAGYMIYQQAGVQDMQSSQQSDTNAYSNYQDQDQPMQQGDDMNMNDDSGVSPDSGNQVPSSQQQQQGNY